MAGDCVCEVLERATYLVWLVKVAPGVVDVRDCMHDGDEAGCGAACFALSAEVLPTVTPALQCRGRAFVFE